MANIIKIKRSTSAGVAPSSLEQGELAINLSDKRLFSANATHVFDAIQNVASNFSITGNFSLRVGNSTVNLVANSTSLKLSNSTVNTGISLPTSEQYSGNYFLHANGSWVEVETGGDTAAVRVYEKFVAEAGQNTFTITGDFTPGYVDVYYNGIHLANDEFAEVGTDTIQLVEDAYEGAVVEVVALSELNVLTVNSVAAGSNSQIQFNNNGSLAGDSGLTWNNVTKSLSVANNLTIGGKSFATGNVSYDAIDYTSSNTSSQTIDSFDKTAYRSAVYEISITSGSDYQSSTVKILHDGTNAHIVESGIMVTNDILAVFGASISGNNVLLTTAPVSAVTTFRLQRTTFKV